MPVHMIFALVSCPGKPMVLQLVMPYARLGARLDNYI